MKKLLACFSFLIFLVAHGQQQVIPLYHGPAPGSESWNWQERTISNNGEQMIFDVVQPTLTTFAPERPNGTAIIIAPGGAFHLLSYDNEGTAVAKWLNQKGITAFVLKYRLVHDDPTHPENNFMALLSARNFKRLDSINAPVVRLALQDGLAAVRYVRQHAATYHIDPSKVGFMGFSAGGTLTMSVVYSATDESRPNFVAPVYAYANAIVGSAVPTTRTPIFIAAASDDDLVPVAHSAGIYSKWQQAKQPAELHLYDKGGHGFGMHRQKLPVDGWIDSFGAWLKGQGLL